MPRSAMLVEHFLFDKPCHQKGRDYHIRLNLTLNCLLYIGLITLDFNRVQLGSRKGGFRVKALFLKL
jgi:hypothetical protein